VSKEPKLKVDYTPLLKNVGKWPRETLKTRLESCVAMLRMNGYLGRVASKTIDRRILRDTGRALQQMEQRNTRKGQKT
jgi:hypothetical protein